MSKVRVLIPVNLNDVRAMLPPQHHLESVRLVDEKGNGAVELIYDDPSRKSPYTFPADQTLEELREIGAERARLAAIQRDRLTQETARLQAEAEAQLKAEEEAKAKEASGAPVDAAPATEPPKPGKGKPGKGK